MKKSQFIGFDAAKVKAAMLANVVKTQNERLISYAKKQIRLIGDAIMLYESKNHMDRTGNLLDSLCWGVSYDGKLVEGGFYREQVATTEAELHELFRTPVDGWDRQGLFPVYGHGLAENFINRYGNRGEKGYWKVFFAILAPYWAYWEKGHQNVMTHRFEQFRVMAHVYDRVKEDIRPAKVRFSYKAPTYNTNKNDNLTSIAKNISNQKTYKRHKRRWPEMPK